MRHVEIPIEAADNRIPSEISEHMRHVTPDPPQNFEENPEAESSEDELIRAYVSINRSKSPDSTTFANSQKTPDPTTFAESQNSPYTKQ